MPKLRSRSGPLIKCARELCNTQFRKWRKRLYCSDRCRKEEWRARHLPYYARLKAESLERRRKVRQQARRYQWVVEGHEDEVPERLTVAEALAQASPETIAEIRELLPELEV